jgi:hypothetical protein
VEAPGLPYPAYVTHLSLVQLVRIAYAKSSCCQGRRCSHHLGNRLSGPVERMGMLIPFLDELFNLLTQVVFGINIDASQALPLDNATPLFNLGHP